MKIRNLFLTIFLFQMLFISCSRDNDEPYGPEYEVDGIELEADYSYYYPNKDTIPADEFAIKLLLKSDNKYAQEYGINPRIESKIADIKVSVLTGGMHSSIVKNDDVSQFFVVDDYKYSYNSLYQTIPQYVEDGVITSLTPSLYFTNQTKLASKYDALITDTIAVTFKVELKLENNNVFSDQISTVLIP